MKQLAALVALTLCACQQPRPAAPAQLTSPAAPRMMAAADYVRSFYANAPAWGSDAEVRALFAADLAEAILADRKAHEGEVPSIDFMFICGCQDGRITDVAVVEQATGFGSQVAAAFKLEGKLRRIDYSLQRTDRGWRIADVRAPAQNGDEAWSLRSFVGLPKLDR